MVMDVMVKLRHVKAQLSALACKPEIKMTKKNQKPSRAFIGICSQLLAHFSVKECSKEMPKIEEHEQNRATRLYK